MMRIRDTKIRLSMTGCITGGREALKGKRHLRAIGRR